MDTIEFNKRIRQTFKFYHYFYVIVSLIFILVSAYFYFLFFCDPFYGNRIDKSFIEQLPLLFIPTVFLVTGMYAFWRLPKEYYIDSISKHTDIALKTKTLDHYVSSLRPKTKKWEDNYLFVKYYDDKMGYIDLYILITTQEIYLNVRSSGHSDKGGLIDFGVSKKARQKIKQDLMACL